MTGLLKQAEAAVPYAVGDVFAAVGNGKVEHFNSSGVLLETLDTTSGGSFTTGMAFDSSGKLYVTAFSASKLAQFDNSGTLLNPNFVAGLATPESVLFDKTGNIFVGNLGNGIRKYDSTGAFLGTVTGTRTDWIDLTADGSTFLFTQEGSAIHTVSNGLPGAAGPDFASGFAGSDRAFALRLLPTGGALLADGVNIKRFDAAGNLIQIYDKAGQDNWFSLNLDPNGTSFWSGDFSTGDISKFDIASGADQFDFNAGTGANTLFGLTVFGEITVVHPAPDAGSTGLMLFLSLILLCVGSRLVRGVSPA